MPDAVPFDARDVGTLLRQPPQRRGAERPEADHDHVLADDLHRCDPTCPDMPPRGRSRVLSPTAGRGTQTRAPAGWLARTTARAAARTCGAGGGHPSG